MSDSRAREIYLQERVSTMQRTIAAALYLLACGDPESAVKARQMLAQLVPELHQEPEDEGDD